MRPAVLVALAGALLVQAVASTFAATAIAPPTFAEWNSKCAPLPGNRQLRGRLPPARLLPLPQFTELEMVLDDFFRLCQTGSLSRRAAWLGSAPGATFLDASRAYFSHREVPFTPFVQRLIVPPGAEVIFHGDLHGDVHSLLARLRWLNDRGYLNGFEITNTNAFLVFLGDYADRGVYGIEVFYTLLRLKLANPDRVFLGRGNHEDVKLAIDYGLTVEGEGKYGRRFNAGKVARFFDFLPVALYVGSGTNFIQGSHAGLEPGFHPGPLLDSPAGMQFQVVGELHRRSFSQRHPQFQKLVQSGGRNDYELTFQDFRPVTPTMPYALGFMWTDFTVVGGEPAFRIDPGRGAVYGEEPTRLLLNASGGTNSALRALMRGHQHSSVLNPMMRRLVASRGVFQHWQSNDSSNRLHAPVSVLAGQLETEPVRRIPPGSVWTFNVSPNSVYGIGSDFDFDAFGIVTVAKNFSEWHLRVVNPTAR
jgi:hypothetical protein